MTAWASAQCTQLAQRPPCTAERDGWADRTGPDPDSGLLPEPLAGVVATLRRVRVASLGQLLVSAGVDTSPDLLVQLVGDLSAQGLVTIHPHQVDRRVLLVELTERGYRLDETSSQSVMRQAG